MLNKKIFYKTLNFSFFIWILIFTWNFSSCVSTSSQSQIAISRNLTDKPAKNSRQLYKFFMANNPGANKTLVKKLSKLYVSECAIENINSDCAFVQMCHETGFLKFGNLVTSEMHNYCGLGAIDAQNPGLSFANEKLGVRAHIQHLHAYATTEDVHLVNECIDPRYKYVLPRGKSPDIFGLSKTWAADQNYGIKLDNLLTRLENY